MYKNKQQCALSKGSEEVRIGFSSYFQWFNAATRCRTYKSIIGTSKRKHHAHGVGTDNCPKYVQENCIASLFKILYHRTLRVHQKSLRR